SVRPARNRSIGESGSHPRLRMIVVARRCEVFHVKFKKGDTVIYPQHGACLVQGTKKVVAFGETQEYLILRTIINEMTLSVPVSRAADVGVRPPVSHDEL